MRLFSFFLAFCLLVNTLMAQDSGYLYIESENSQPFYIRTQDSLYMSAPEGYLILAPLKQIKGDLILGFPGQAAAAFVFSIGSSSWEKGFVLRDMKQEGWRLYDYKEEEMVNIRRLGKTEDRYVGMRKRTDPFAMRLAQLVNDTAVLYYRPLDPSVAGASKKAPTPSRDTIAIAKTSPAVDTITLDKAPAKDTLTLAKASVSKDTATVMKAAAPKDTIAIAKPVAAKDTVALAKTVPQEDTIEVAKKVPPRDSITGAKTLPMQDTMAKAGTVPEAAPRKDSAAAPVTAGFDANIRLVSKQETRTSYIYTYEIVEGLKREKVEVEIPKEN
jgi:hypothetical protein